MIKVAKLGHTSQRISCVPLPSHIHVDCLYLLGTLAGGGGYRIISPAENPYTHVYSQHDATVIFATRRGLLSRRLARRPCPETHVLPPSELLKTRLTEVVGVAAEQFDTAKGESR